MHHKIQKNKQPTCKGLTKEEEKKVRQPSKWPDPTNGCREMCNQQMQTNEQKAQTKYQPEAQRKVPLKQSAGTKMHILAPKKPRPEDKDNTGCKRQTPKEVLPIQKCHWPNGRNPRRAPIKC